MDIPEIKSRLTLAQVLHHYNLKPDKNQRLLCPFHEDNTPSLQVYYQTHTAYCFSSNCKTHGKSLDVIDFVMHKENCTKHAAIEKAKEMLNVLKSRSIAGTPAAAATTRPAEPLTRIAILTKMFTYFKNAVASSPPAREYIKSRSLDYTQLEIGYNTAQFHHGTRKDQALIQSCLQVGLLYEFGTNTRTGGQSYAPFGKYGIVLPLKNKSGQIVSLYFRSILPEQNSLPLGEGRGGAQKHYYLKDRQGLYPGYPESSAKKLILTEAIIDAATLLQIEEIKKQYSVLSCYGTNGMTEEHKEAIRELKNLNEIIFAFDNDEAGSAGAKKYSRELKHMHPHIKITALDLPCKDVNETAQAHTAEIFPHLLEQRKEIIFSTEITPEKVERSEIPPLGGENKVVQQNPVPPKQVSSETQSTKPNLLNTENPYNLHYQSPAAHYYINGGIRCPLDSMKVSIQVVSKQTRLDIRFRYDLYEYKHVQAMIRSTSEKLCIEAGALEKDFSILTKLLETYRAEQLKQQQSKVKKITVQLPQATVQQCVTFLEKPNLLDRLNELIGRAGVVGEEKSRLFLFAIGSSYKMPDTLHALIQGSSGSGKTRLLKVICSLMPGEDVIKFTRVTEGSLYNYPEDFLVNKLLGFEDIDGLKEDAQYAVRELISNEILISSTSAKGEDGQISAMQKTVRGPMASISCTTHGRIYEDNMNRVFLIAVDESREQTRRIIEHQQKRSAGEIESHKEEQIKEFIQNCVRLLKPCPVINPYAHKIHLPEEADQLRRLNDLYISLVKQITLLHQYQRKKDDKGRLITTLEDLQAANEIMFESIVLKVDELDGSLRQFYEQLKALVKKEGKENSFVLREIRHALRVSKTRLHRYINDLTSLQYIEQTGGHANKGYSYKITYWDDIEAIRSKIKTHLQKQIESLPKENPASFHHNGKAQAGTVVA